MMRMLIIACVLAPVAGNFLRKGPAPEELRVSVQELESDLLQEIQESLGESRGLSRVAVLENALNPIYLALDKNENGYLGQAAVRYVLHRYFVQRHGWFLKGLEPVASTWNESAPTEILEDRVPNYVLKLFDDRLGSRGLSLREVAVLAATLEHLAHDEALSRLGDVYRAHEMPVDSPSEESMVEAAIDTYMMGYVLGTDFHGLRPQRLRQVIRKAYPTWSDTEEFLRDVRLNDAYATRDRANPFQAKMYTFQDAVRVIESVGDQYGRFQDTECRAMKDVLITMEDRGSGRVRLSNFYNRAVGGTWQFTESVSALREVGALDETDPANLRVIIPNYIASPSNCLSTSSFYTTCCMDECEPILGRIENRIGAPRATPDDILAIASDVDSPTVDAPRNFSSGLRQRLEEVGKAHGGRVPLHGRLFAQWLHHAFPRECPYPHAPGSQSGRSRMDWKGESDVVATEEQMMMHAENATNPSMLIDELYSETEDVGHLPWTDEEFLVVQSKNLFIPGQGSGGNNLWAMARCVALISAFASVSLGLARTAAPMLAVISSGESSSKEHLV